jgi:hypothetical protein
VNLGSAGTRQITLSHRGFAMAQQYVRNYERLWRALEEVFAINRELLRLQREEDRGAS